MTRRHGYVVGAIKTDAGSNFNWNRTDAGKRAGSGPAAGRAPLRPGAQAAGKYSCSDLTPASPATQASMPRAAASAPASVV